MRPEAIGAQESQVSLTRDEVARLGELALENGEIDMAVSLKGIGAVMDTMVTAEPVSDQLQLEVEATEAVEPELLEPTKREKAANALRLGVKKIRGVRRPKEHRKPEYTYGGDL